MGCQVTDTSTRTSDGQDGQGCGAYMGARLDVQWSVLRRNHTAGFVAYKGSGSLVGSVVLDTLAATYALPGEAEPRSLADGLLAFDAPLLLAERTLFVATPRAGIFLDGGPGATLLGIAATQGGYGLVVQHGGALVESGVALWNNAIQNRVSDTGFGVPPPPDSLSQSAP